MRWAVAAIVTAVLSWVALGHTGSVTGAARFSWIPFEPYIALFTQDVPLVAAIPLLVIDLVGNIALFVPFGAAVYIAVEARSTRPVLIAAVAGLALSVIFEAVQFFIPGRVVATTDIILNALGAYLGAIALDWIWNLSRS